MNPTNPARREFRVELSVSLSHLTFAPVMNRRTFYGKVTVGRRTYWLQRWDTGRCLKDKPFAHSRDRLMCWTAGVRS